jgi:hypothetical protein
VDWLPAPTQPDQLLTLASAPPARSVGTLLAHTVGTHACTHCRGSSCTHCRGACLHTLSGLLLHTLSGLLLHTLSHAYTHCRMPAHTVACLHTDPSFTTRVLEAVEFLCGACLHHGFFPHSQPISQQWEGRCFVLWQNRARSRLISDPTLVITAKRSPPTNSTPLEPFCHHNHAFRRTTAGPHTFCIWIGWGMFSHPPPPPPTQHHPPPPPHTHAHARVRLDVALHHCRPAHMQQLLRIVEATGADIILSSTWREQPSSFRAVTARCSSLPISKPSFATFLVPGGHSTVLFVSN